MAWYDEAIFYHIYPLGLTGAPKQNEYKAPEYRLNTLIPWISHIKEIGCNAIYIGPLFESVGHGYETTDYKKLDSRLGTNEDLKNFVAEAHKQGVRVVFDGVFNHTGRDFFAFQDIKRNRENSPYKDWYCNVNFWGNNEYNDGFSYDNWGGYNLLAKLNQRNPAVIDYICDVIRFWVSEFDVDGIRLDAADVLDFNFMQALRHVANTVKPEFWLMGEVIHGEYSRWVNEGTLHSVTNYHLHKALFSGHNDHNYFEIAHTVKRLYGMGGNQPGGLKLYNFVDNHDVERIYTKLNDKEQFVPTHILLYTLPGIPSLYYGSEFGIEGRKERYSDDSLRPALNLADFWDAIHNNPCTRLITALGKIRQNTPEISFGDYQELMLTTRQYAFSRNYNGISIMVSVNNDENPAHMTFAAGNCPEYIGALSGQKVRVENGHISVTIPAHSGEIWIPATGTMAATKMEPIPAYVALEPANTSAKKEEVEQEERQPGNICVEKDAVEKKEPQSVNTVVEKVKDIEPKVEEVLDPAERTNLSDVLKSVGEVTKNHKYEEFPKKAEKAKAPDPVNVMKVEQPKKEAKAAKPVEIDWSKPYEEMTVEELQACVLAKLAKNGPVTDQMKKDVSDNVYHNSLVNWVKSFR